MGTTITLNRPAAHRAGRWVALCCLGVAALTAGCSSDSISPGPVDVTGGSLDGGGRILDASVDDTGPALPPDCPAGYAVWPPEAPTSCVVAGELQCTPCFGSDSCLGGQCQEVGGDGPYCQIPCRREGTADSCPAGSTCTPSADGGAFCRPDNDSCSCNAGNLGQQRPCASKQTGCAGSQTCGAGGWSLCDAPGASLEQCNGLDDDCDGLTDNGLPATQACALGDCVGSATCGGTAGWVCDAKPAAAEVCNLLDDDCDGVTDEPWRVDGVLTSAEHCGVCGNSCAGAVLHGTATCDALALPPFCALATCEPGYTAAGNACVPKVVGACDPCAVDFDCGVVGKCVATGKPGLPAKVCALPCASAGACSQGATCTAVAGQGQKLCVPAEATCTCGPKNAGAKRACTRSTDAGTCNGQETCVPGSGWLGCTAPTPAAETCNGVDDDCDGTLDESAGAGADCPVSNPYGVCTGKTVCTGQGGLLCTGAAPAEDVCNGKDDDCDGQTDEGALDPKTGTYTALAHCGVCNNTCPVPTAAHTQAVCDPTGGKGGAPACGISCDSGWVDANGETGDGCECKSGATDDAPGGGDVDCDGVDGVASKAVFVAKWGNDLWAGTVTLPVASLKRGLQLAVSLKRPHVYVGAGAWAENVTLQPGVSLYGGYGPGFKVRDPAAWETLVVGQATPTAHSAAMRCEGIVGTGAPTRVDGLSITGPSATVPGGNSYALLSTGCGARLQVVGCRISAGQGGKGPDGAVGGNGAPGSPGGDGSKGKDVGHSGCGFSDHTPGGLPGVQGCGDAVVSGGDGGMAVCPDYHEKIKPPQCSVYGNGPFQTTSPNAKGGFGKGPQGGAGGVPGGDAYTDPHDGTATSCKSNNHDCDGCIVPLMPRVGQPGSPGKSGAAGGSGPAGAGGGATALGWQGQAGGPGGGGKHGSGGGGGGSGGGVEVVGCVGLAGYSDIGGSGGGGGSGGCAGQGGGGGGPGGGAVAVYIATTGANSPVLTGNTLIGGTGGSGGAGGSGGWGGPGAPGGVGGAGTPTEKKNDCAPEGGDGGDGGDGGSGGGGGGGAGGPAWLVAAKGPSQAWLTAIGQANVLLKPGVPGSGGPGGAGAPHSGKSGGAGDSATLRRWP